MCLRLTNTLAYWGAELITTVESFIIQNQRKILFWKNQFQRLRHFKAALFQILSEQFALWKVDDETRRFNHLSGDVVMQVDPEVVRVHVDFGRVDRVDYVGGHSGYEHSND